MKHVYILFHSYELDDNEEIKILGVYSNEILANENIVKYLNLPGFKDYPDGFHIDKYEVDNNKWTEGFIKWEEAN